MFPQAQGAGWLNQINANFAAVNPQYVQAYYVDNVNGSANNNGQAWSSAYAQISTAITAWEAWRALQANLYAKGVIYVRGTGTAYAALTALPSYCDIIGVGAQSNGNGTGIVMIGANGAAGIAGTARGLGLFNLQIISGGAFYCADFVSLFRSEIAHCDFQAKDVATSGAIRFSASSGGNWIHDNWMTGSGNVCHVLGMDIAGPNFDSNRIERNLIVGTTNGVYVRSTCSTGQNGTAADNTVFDSNFIGDFGRGCAVAINDDEVSGMISYTNNIVYGTATITMVNNGVKRCHGNISYNGYATVTAS